MKKVFTALLTISCVSALIACVYVCFYNHVGELTQIGRARDGYRGWFSLTIRFSELQWYAFLVPLAGLAAGLSFRKAQHEFGVFLAAAFMLIFALAWAFLAVFVWQNQSIPHTN
jgi:hypothetical protein